MGKRIVSRILDALVRKMNRRSIPTPFRLPEAFRVRGQGGNHRPIPRFFTHLLHKAPLNERVVLLGIGRGNLLSIDAKFENINRTVLLGNFGQGQSSRGICVTKVGWIRVCSMIFSNTSLVISKSSNSGSTSMPNSLFFELGLLREIKPIVLPNGFKNQVLVLRFFPISERSIASSSLSICTAKGSLSHLLNKD